MEGVMGMRKNRVAKVKRPAGAKTKGIRKPKFIREAERAAQFGVSSVRITQHKALHEKSSGHTN